MSNKDNFINNDKNDIKKYNIGIAILKIIMCFEVVFIHTKNISNISNSNLIVKLLFNFASSAVPVFMILSFIFTDFKKLTDDKSKFKNRLIRLLLPQIAWTIIYFVIYKIIDFRFSTNLINSNFDFFYQLLLGHAYNKTIWFQIDLIFLTIIFGFIFWLFDEKKAIKITIFLGILALFLQYSYINSRLFDNIIFKKDYLKDYIIYPIGRITEMVPFAVLGILISHFNVLKRLEKYRWYMIFISLIGIIYLLNFNVFSYVPGYAYQGINLLFMGSLLIIIFYLLPLQILKDNLKKIIISISKKTMGIYFAHRLIATLIYVTKLNNIFSIKEGSLLSCVFIFVISYLVILLVCLIPSKKIKMAFI